MSNSVWLHAPQHARFPCPPPTPGVYSNSCPWSRWCHPTISSSVIPFSSYPQSFPASGSFQMSQFFASCSQRIRVSASTSVLPNEYSGLIFFRMDWLDLLAVPGTLKPSAALQHHFLGAQFSFWSNSHIRTWLLEKLYSFDYIDLCWESDVSAF